MGCEMEKISITMNKPIYLRQAILDLSKIIMCEVHYTYTLPRYGKNLQLCYMDTDSFIYNIETDDFCKDIDNDAEARFNTSGYSCSCLLSIGVNKKVIGLMKDELGGRIITDLVALRPKLYTYKTLGESGNKRCN